MAFTLLSCSKEGKHTCFKEGCSTRGTSTAAAQQGRVSRGRETQYKGAPCMMPGIPLSSGNVHSWEKSHPPPADGDAVGMVMRRARSSANYLRRNRAAKHRK